MQNKEVVRAYNSNKQSSDEYGINTMYYSRQLHKWMHDWKMVSKLTTVQCKLLSIYHSWFINFPTSYMYLLMKLHSSLALYQIFISLTTFNTHISYCHCFVSNRPLVSLIIIQTLAISKFVLWANMVTQMWSVALTASLKSKTRIFGLGLLEQ